MSGRKTANTKTASASSQSRKKPCPKCGSLDVVPIEYGEPGPEMMDEAEKGLIELGGCCVGDRDPRRHCKACGAQFDRPRASRRSAHRGQGAGKG